MPSIPTLRSPAIALLFSPSSSCRTCWQLRPHVLAISELSCHGSSQRICCFNSPGGLPLLTQFWDTDPVTRSADSWTIHGLWPDNCDGSYEQDCDKSREYSNITAIVEARGRTQALNDVNTF
ncbi:ribonuclease T2 [Blastomyces percursus]|uniref:Ribonuclease T2 n=1 Tax=Blastomyces percursus TaxID=1658174 RepID=A0A1J9RH23_9EURO|nr:ribonuclease T2 [Blastomyces percursus]